MEKHIPIQNKLYDLNSSKVFKKIKTLNPAISHILLQDETMESVCLAEYGNPDLWWVISLYNDILDPFNPQAQKSIVYLPDKTDLYNFMLGALLNG